MDLWTTEPFRSDSRTFFSNLRTFGLKNLRTHEPSNLRTFGLIGCNPPRLPKARSRRRTAVTERRVTGIMHNYHIFSNTSNTSGAYVFFVKSFRFPRSKCVFLSTYIKCRPTCLNVRIRVRAFVHAIVCLRVRLFE